MLRIAVLLLILVLFLLDPISSSCDTWVVQKDGTGDCTRIQGCVNSAANGDTILVGPGIYIENISIMHKSDFVLKSEQGPTKTTISNAPIGLFYPCLTCGDVTGESVIEGFTFAHCGAAQGGGINAAASTLTIRGNVLFDCVAATFEGGPSSGGAIAIHQGSGHIVQNTIYDCWAGVGGAGGGIYVSGSPALVIDRNTIVGCVGGGIWADAMPVIACNDVWNNVPSNYGGAITDQTGLNGNIALGPMFCNPIAEDFSLHWGSPCLNAPGCGLLGALPMGCGETPIQESTWGRIKTLFR